MTTMKKLRAAIERVEREIQRLGLWVPEMDDVQVYLTPVHIWYGWTNMHTGNIFIPRVSVSLRQWTLLNVLRHEYGHALTFHRPEILEDWPDYGDAVSKYAATNTDEDFAETFKYFVKHKGRLPRAWKNHAGIVERWQMLSEMGA
ncbi:MAG: hypothetical protein IH600_05700 [Bacteroidetes bacterium]|nr:hypothetical protein [Bacteroidota bacterium]